MGTNGKLVPIVQEYVLNTMGTTSRMRRPPTIIGRRRRLLSAVRQWDGVKAKARTHRRGAATGTVISGRPLEIADEVQGETDHREAIAEAKRIGQNAQAFTTYHVKSATGGGPKSRPLFRHAFARAASTLQIPRRVLR